MVEMSIQKGKFTLTDEFPALVVDYGISNTIVLELQ